MGRNNLKAVRKKAGLTQTDLAKKVQTSQQQIQRIEAGQTVRLDLAMRICNALSTTLGKVFPEAKPGLKRLHKAKDAGEFWEIAHDASDDLAKGGLDGDFRQWHLVVTLTSGAKRSYPLAGVELSRVWRALQEKAKPKDETLEFVAFDTDECTVALNPAYVAHALACWDPPTTVFERPERSQSTASFYLVNGPEPLEIQCEPDPEIPEDLDHDSEEYLDIHDKGQFRSLFYTLETWAERNSFEQITDIDGESNLIKLDVVAAVEAPHWLLGYEYDEAGEESDAGTADPTGAGSGEPSPEEPA